MDRLESTLLILIASSTACGGTKGPPPGRADAGPTPDAGPSADGMPQNVCTDIESVYGDLGEFTGTAVLSPADEDTPDGPKKLVMQMPLNDDAEPDVLFLEFWETEEPFLSQGFVALSQTLNGDQADLVTCGACSFIAANYVDGGLIDFNMAYAGELVIDAIDATPGTGSVSGSLTGLKFREVTISPAGQETVEGGCRSELASASFSFSVEEAPAAK